MVTAFQVALFLIFSLTLSGSEAKPLAANRSVVRLLKPKTQKIPSACFQMGSHETEPQRNQNEQRHRVCVKRFEIAEQEVSIADFKRFVAATHYITDAEINFIQPGCWTFDEKKQQWGWWAWANWQHPVQGPVDERQPVSCVNYYDIQAYIAWLNKTTGERYRLPTEAEWEYAARAGSSSRYYWGNNPDFACRHANIGDRALQRRVKKKGAGLHDCDDHSVYAAPVKQYLPNKFHLYDMTGNVWEWTCSEFKADYHGQETQCAKSVTDSLFLAVRGGGWNVGSDRARLAYRNWESPWVRLSTWGFRLVREKRFIRLLKRPSRK